MLISDLETYRNLQDTYKKIFGVYDLEKSLLWMAEECGEVIGAIRKNKEKEDILGELGDLQNWIISVSNILGIEWEQIIKCSLIKEIDRQLNQYGKLKYTSIEEVDEIMELYKKMKE